jgi:hypothetical protein
MHGLTTWKEKHVMGHSCEINKTICLILKLIFFSDQEDSYTFPLRLPHFFSGSLFVTHVPSPVIVATIENTANIFIHIYIYIFSKFISRNRGPSSVVGIATAYGLDGPVIESRWGRDLPHLSRPALRPTQPPVQWVPGLSRG